MKEADLIRRKAARMNEEEIGAEIARIQRAIPAAQSASASARYETRLQIFRAYLTKFRARTAMRRSAEVRRSA